MYCFLLYSENTHRTLYSTEFTFPVRYLYMGQELTLEFFLENISVLRPKFCRSVGLSLLFSGKLSIC